MYITDKISARSRWFVQQHSKKTISILEIEKSIYTLCYRNSTYHQMIQQSYEINKKDLIFPSSISKRFLRGDTNVCITATSSVFLSSCIQFICKCMLQTGISYLNQMKHKQLHMIYIQSGIQSDVFLNYLFQSLHIQCFCRTPRNIHQKTNCIPKSMIEQYIRKLVQPYSLKISKQVFFIIQFYIEQYMIYILKKAHLISNNNNHNKVLPKDIQCVLQILDIHIEYPIHQKIEFMDSDME